MDMRVKWLAGGLVGGVLAGAALVGLAEGVPLSFKASPEVYKVLAEDDQVRVVLATWPPGYKDKSHSHPKAAVYTIKDCHRRIHKADGTTDDKQLKPGSARINPPVPTHQFENIGKTECQQVLVEIKK